MNFEGYRAVKDGEVKTLYCFNKNGRFSSFPAQFVKGVSMVHEITGECITCYGFMPWSEFFGCQFYNSEENLRKYGMTFFI